MKLLKIIKCDDALKWYSNLIGEYAQYRGPPEWGEYKSFETAGYTNFISEGDAEVVDFSESTRKGDIN